MILRHTKIAIFNITNISIMIRQVLFYMIIDKIMNTIHYKFIYKAGLSFIFEYVK